MNCQSQFFWQLTVKYSKPTRTLVGYIFSLKGHAAPVETLFSPFFLIPSDFMNVENLSQTS